MATIVQNNSRLRANKPQNEPKDEILYQIVLESTDADTDDGSIESICSIQAETTVSAKDSSDISTCDESEYSSEFELASSPANTWRHPWCFDQNISSGSSPHQINIIDIEQIETESNDEFELSSNSSNPVDSDTSVKTHRFQYCAMCSSLNCNPSFQFCHACYKIKKGFFPEKPAAKKKRKYSRREKDSKAYKKLKLMETEVKSSVSDDTDSSSALASNSNNHLEISACNILGRLNKENAITHSSETVFTNVTDSGFESQNNNSQEWNSVVNENEEEKCLACLLNNTNALFLHGKTGHRCCCYRCAKRIWFESRRCPICRCKVSNVIRILNT